MAKDNICFPPPPPPDPRTNEYVIIIKKSHIEFMLTQLDAYKIKAAKRPEFKPYVDEIVDDIKSMLDEYVAAPVPQ
jgi:hypothetical protein